MKLSNERESIVKQYLVKTVMLTLVSLASGGCGTKPDEGGQCSLQCGNAIIGANDPDFKIETWASNTKISCSVKAAEQTLSDSPVTLKFLAYRGLSSGAHQPVPGMAFSPVSSSPVFKTKTVPDDFCSDSCGVMTVDFTPTCPQVGSVFDVSVYVNSGALRSDIVTVSIETEKPIEAALANPAPGREDEEVISTEEVAPGVKVTNYRKKSASNSGRKSDHIDRGTR
jgi:hypothetical protein